VVTNPWLPKHSRFGESDAHCHCWGCDFFPDLRNPDTAARTSTYHYNSHHFRAADHGSVVRFLIDHGDALAHRDMQAGAGDRGFGGYDLVSCRSVPTAIDAVKMLGVPRPDEGSYLQSELQSIATA
jgi:hypothetical protein